ncbi:MAG: hypothetical protein AAF570_24425 [Bacteroidota bacterium]
MRTLETENKDLKAKLAACGKEKAELKTQLSDLNVQVSGFASTRADLEANINGHQSEIGQLKAKIATLEAGLKTAQANLDLANKENGTHKAEIASLNARITDLEKQLASAQADLKAETAKCQGLHASMADLENQFAKANDELGAKSEEITGLNATIADLNAQLTACQSSLKTANDKAAVVAVPVVKPAEEKPKAKLSKEETAKADLERVAAKRDTINFGRIGMASADVKDDLKRVSGIGPFIEKKLNALGIYTFLQISKFTDEDVEAVTKAIEFFPGRIERDNWISQSGELKDKAVDEEEE